MNTINNAKGQMVVGLAILVGLIAFILMNNLQSENKLLVSKILDVRSRLEAESAIDTFGRELYKSYLLSAVIPDSISNDRRLLPTTTDPTSTLEFNINGNQICNQRKIGGVDVPICIKLPADFMARLRQENSPSFKYAHDLRFELLNYFFKQNEVRAEIKKNYLSQPVPAGAGSSTNFAPNFVNPAFLKEYSRYNCNTDPTVLKCVKVKICIKPSGCDAVVDSDKIVQTYVFTLAPKSLLRE